MERAEVEVGRKQTLLWRHPAAVWPTPKSMLRCYAAQGHTEWASVGHVCILSSLELHPHFRCHVCSCRSPHSLMSIYSGMESSDSWLKQPSSHCFLMHDRSFLQIWGRWIPLAQAPVWLTWVLGYDMCHCCPAGGRVSARCLSLFKNLI